MPSSSMFPNRVQHLCGRYLHLQPGLHDPGLALPHWVLLRGGQAEGLPPQTGWHVLCLCRYVSHTELHGGSTQLLT